MARVSSNSWSLIIFTSNGLSCHWNFRQGGCHSVNINIPWSSLLSQYIHSHTCQLSHIIIHPLLLIHISGALRLTPSPIPSTLKKKNHLYSLHHVLKTSLPRFTYSTTLLAVTPLPNLSYKFLYLYHSMLTHHMHLLHSFYPACPFVTTGVHFPSKSLMHGRITGIDLSVLVAVYVLMCRRGWMY